MFALLVAWSNHERFEIGRLHFPVNLCKSCSSRTLAVTTLQITTHLNHSFMCTDNWNGCGAGGEGSRRDSRRGDWLASSYSWKESKNVCLYLTSIICIGEHWHWTLHINLTLNKKIRLINFVGKFACIFRIFLNFNKFLEKKSTLIIFYSSILNTLFTFKWIIKFSFFIKLHPIIWKTKTENNFP